MDGEAPARAPGEWGCAAWRPREDAVVSRGRLGRPRGRGRCKPDNTAQKKGAEMRMGLWCDTQATGWAVVMRMGWGPHQKVVGGGDEDGFVVR